MKATGIVVEYNPLHNGHVYHAQQAKKVTGSDIIIAVMSGNFLQRGEPAFVDKWTRTKMALATGVDLLFELPYRYATGHAPVFAEGAIRLLDAAGCTAFCFGSEEGDIGVFKQSLKNIDSSRDTYEFTVKQAIQEGTSYPKALNKAYETIRERGLGGADLSKPNNILGFHYMQAAMTIGSDIMPSTIQRLGADYHKDSLELGEIASATGIRKSYFSTSSLKEVMDFVPATTGELLDEWQEAGLKFGNWESFYPYLRFIILREGPEKLAHIADITEGIENLIYKAAKDHSSYQPFMETVKSKRYTWTRIQRMLTHILTGFTYNMRDSMHTPSYLRLLGMTNEGRAYLNEKKKSLHLPLISKAASFSDPSLDMDIHASSIYALATGQMTGLDYTTSPIIGNHFSSNSFK
ncbi:nucleotidyltransferase [Sporosarcina oncorhynchi]|uniref:tRNA(Met) cytidine acetate ligase n=1 Tax=Sporosarcina oncorhynchi TaxID=3056444 RepID=A0ABZ0L0S5_9BACL|nr:nucleotidyltransferase [Sporosarcina sp. T2O-4]WOV86211.1 nucleotidyltransferase [Sporosarcina sp. T2O-4]